jgi:uncharacterized damage-inducible protein DinB
MKLIVVFLALLLPFGAYAQNQKAPTLKSILLEQLRTTHNQKDWFVPVSVAVEGITPDQARWKDASGNHSIGQLTHHLLFWDRQQLAKFKGETEPKFSGNNEETFNNFDSAQWTATVQQLDQVLTDLEKLVEAADDKKLQEWSSAVAHIGAHNAYHTGQIVYIRRLQGSWNPEKGVK